MDQPTKEERGTLSSPRSRSRNVKNIKVNSVVALISKKMKAWHQGKSNEVK